MNSARSRTLTIASIACAMLLGSLVSAQAPDQKPRFAAPERILAGGTFLGEGRLYPSPVLQDIDGDNRLDVVIGDLFGRVTVALQSSGDPAGFGPEAPLKGEDGKPLKFHNW